MKQFRHNIIRAGLDALYFTGAYHVLRPIFSGIGAILMLHNVRPPRDDAVHVEAGAGAGREPPEQRRLEPRQVGGPGDLHRVLRPLDEPDRTAGLFQQLRVVRRLAGGGAMRDVSENRLYAKSTLSL